MGPAIFFTLRRSYYGGSPREYQKNAAAFLAVPIWLGSPGCGQPCAGGSTHALSQGFTQMSFVARGGVGFVLPGPRPPGSLQGAVLDVPEGSLRRWAGGQVGRGAPSCILIGDTGCEFLTVRVGGGGHPSQFCCDTGRKSQIVWRNLDSTLRFQRSKEGVKFGLHGGKLRFWGVFGVQKLGF